MTLLAKAEINSDDHSDINTGEWSTRSRSESLRDTETRASMVTDEVLAGSFCIFGASGRDANLLARIDRGCPRTTDKMLLISARSPGMTGYVFHQMRVWWEKVKNECHPHHDVQGILVKIKGTLPPSTTESHLEGRLSIYMAHV